MADRMPQYFNDSMHSSHLQRTIIPEVSSFNTSYQRSILSDTSSSNYVYRPMQRNASLRQNDFNGTGIIPHANTTHFNSTRQLSAPYYMNSNVMNSNPIDVSTPSRRLDQTISSIADSGDSGIPESDLNISSWSFASNGSSSTRGDQLMRSINDGTVTLQLGNLDTTSDQASLKQYLISKLQPITPILSFTFEGVIAKVCVPSVDHAKHVVSYLHRKKVGHKRITVSYTKDCSSLDPSMLRCQVAGLLKDVPYYRLSLYKFRELFQSRFKTSISVANLCSMSDICTVVETVTEKFVCLRPELIQSIERGELNEVFRESVPYCSIHFKKGPNHGWAEQEIEPLPNVHMSVAEVRSILYSLTQKHTGNIPVATLFHCIQGELQYNIVTNEKGVNLEHLISCVSEIQITTNKFGIKVLNWIGDVGNNHKDLSDDHSKGFSKGVNVADAYGKFSTEVIDLLTACPKSTMKFSKFIPTYHNTFSKQCRVADYGYVKLIDLFEAIPLIVHIMGEGDNRQITLTHQYQMRRLANDLNKFIRSTTTKSIRLSHVPMILSSNHKKFEITDYGVCYLNDIVETLQNNNLILFDSLTKSDDIVMSLPKRRQSNAELRKTSEFARETIDLLKNAPQYTIAYEKFSCSYHYHLSYQLRLSDYGHTKLADMMEGLAGIVKVELSSDEQRKLFLYPKVAQRIFSEQLRDITEMITGKSFSFINVSTVLEHHKKKFGYQMKATTLGFKSLWNAIKSIPYVEVIIENDDNYMVCHHDDDNYKFKSQLLTLLLDSLTLEANNKFIPVSQLINSYYDKFEEQLCESMIESMNHLFDIHIEDNIKVVSLSSLALFLLPIISILKTVQSITASQLNAELQSKINSANAFFQIGYPDLKSLIKSFPDIFSVNEWTENSEITFNQDSIYAASHDNSMSQSILSPIKKSIPAVKDVSYKYKNNSMVSEHRVPFGELVTNNMNQEFKNASSYVPVKFVRPNVNETTSNNFANTTKENFSYFANNAPANTYQESNSPVNQRRNLKRTFDQISRSQFEEIDEITSSKMSAKNLFSLYLPNASTESNFPYWMDPIWHTSPSPPYNKSFNIPIPELQTFPFEAKLDTPSVMGRLARKHQGRFRFDTK